MKIARPRVSYADLEQAPEAGRRYELYDGEMFVVVLAATTKSPSPSSEYRDQACAL